MLAGLLPVARQIFAETFAANYDAQAFELFCDGVYATDGSMARDFTASEVWWQVAKADSALIGYAKLTALRAPAAHAAGGARELQQIYVQSDWHGTGVADALIRWAIDKAGSLGAPELYLTVFDHNERAKRFYTRHGFREVGRCTFRLGNRVDDDRIWCRALR